MHELKEGVLDQVSDEISEPSWYKVIMFNDDYTTMDFVVMVLMQIFNKSLNESQRIMMAIHRQGSAVCGVYPFDVAETKVGQVQMMAEAHQFPLRCGLEEE